MRRAIVSLIVGVLLAVAAIVVMRLYIGSVTRPATEADVVPVAVMVKDVPGGYVLKSKDIQLVAWPKGSVPSGAFSDVDEIFKGAKSDEDRVAIVAMVRGEPVLRSKVSGLGNKPVLSAMVGPGMRAVSVKIDDVSGVSGFILPGDHVDILLTRHIGRTSDSDLVTDVLLQHVKVLGIDQLADTEHTKPVVGHTATVEVSPDEASKLALAQQAGTLSLALRNPESGQADALARIGESDLARRGSLHGEGGNVIVRYGTQPPQPQASDNR
jgi:pilus assembly protein CpaB